MKRTFTTLALLLGVVLAFGTSLNALAGPASSGDLLIQAYATLEKADHDYKGHRKDAMKQIEAAGKEMGINVRGDGKGHEAQGVSDDQLHAAQGLLEQARGGLKGKALKHVHRALHELEVALKIK